MPTPTSSSTPRTTGPRRALITRAGPRGQRLEAAYAKLIVDYPFVEEGAFVALETPMVTSLEKEGEHRHYLKMGTAGEDGTDAGLYVNENYDEIWRAFEQYVRDELSSEGLSAACSGDCKDDLQSVTLENPSSLAGIEGSPKTVTFFKPYNLFINPGVRPDTAETLSPSWTKDVATVLAESFQSKKSANVTAYLSWEASKSNCTMS
jgi:hypothetical protein